jgi:prolyl-tRNA synthetase
MAFDKNQLTKKSENISDWYNQTILLAGLAEYGPAKGTMIIKPYGYAIWEIIQKEMDKKIKDKGVENAYFPMFIPESLLNKEKNHIEGFSPELAVVTIGGGEELEERLVIRPTSETIMYDTYSKWVQSWRDLPILINQWNNVVRWEKRTYLFLRTSEFLWQEGHTAHATHEEATDTQVWAMQMYENTYRDIMAMPGIVGRKSNTEKFAGADGTLTYEMLMPGGKALQSCTSHDLGQNFSKSFDIKFQDKEGKLAYAWQTSWGFSTRSIGGLILMHGDDKGLIFPSKIAPTQVVIIPVKAEEEIMNYCSDIQSRLKTLDIRVKIDSHDEKSIGFRINEWEAKGAPIRIEIGKYEIADNQVTIARRDTGEKVKIALSDLESTITKFLDEIQSNLYERAEKYLAENTFNADSYEQFKNIMATTKGFIKSFWCEDAACEAKIKEETTATTRCLPLDSKEENGKCIYCNKDAKHRWIFAQSY